MTTKRIVFTGPDGVVTLSPTAPRNDGETEASYFERIHAETVTKWIRDGLLPPGKYPMTVVEIADIPTDRSYRDAWTFDGKAFGVDLAKAKIVHEDKMRSELKRQKPALEAKATADIGAAKSLDELKRVKL